MECVRVGAGGLFGTAVGLRGWGVNSGVGIGCTDASAAVPVEV